MAVDRRVVYLETDGMGAEAVFGRLDAELKAGRSAWLTGGLLAALGGQMGRGWLGRSWLILRPRRFAAPDWAFRGRDVAASVLALVALSPLFAVIALLVKRSSPGPVFYSTQVVGENGRRFTWYKFRSMRVVPRGEDESRRSERYRAYAEGKRQSTAAGNDSKIVDESRVTPIGRVLRKYSLDELPQLYNVLKGQMSLVGPRPCLPYEAEMFPRWARRRFEVRPGLTGVWQVFGRGRSDFEEGLAMDVYYVYARSLWLDLKLILLTVAVVVRGQGAR